MALSSDKASKVFGEHAILYVVLAFAYAVLTDADAVAALLGGGFFDHRNLTMVRIALLPFLWSTFLFGYASVKALTKSTPSTGGARKLMMHRSRLRLPLAFPGWLAGAIVSVAPVCIRHTPRFLPAYEITQVKVVNSAIGGGSQDSSEHRAALTQTFAGST